jgi:tagatose-1,6-bisphosphate aldolase non-catalytic subunit AgaZ/GatZ
MNMPDFDDEDHVSGTLRWKDVVLPASVTESDVDKLIFAALRGNWRKVAMIVGNVFQMCETRSIPLSDEVIAARIQELAEAGRIESQGNLTKWRYSEVRLRQG